MKYEYNNNNTGMYLGRISKHFPSEKGPGGYFHLAVQSGPAREDVKYFSICYSGKFDWVRKYPVGTPISVTYINDMHKSKDRGFDVLVQHAVFISRLPQTKSLKKVTVEPNK